MGRPPPHPALALFNPAVQQWFEASFDAPTAAQARAWPSIANRDSTLLLAPTGSGKTLAAFLCCLDRLLFLPVPDPGDRCRILYVSPLKALAVDVERNLRAPLAGIARVATARGDAFHVPEIAVRTGDTPAAERARFGRAPADILITTPESLYLLLTSNARLALRAVDTVILDEIHALVPTKRGAHLALSLERLEALTGRPLQRIGLSATQRPLEEVARFLGGAEPRSGGTLPAPVPAPLPVPVIGEGVDAQLGTGEAVRYRPVTVVDAGARKALSLRIEVPVEDMAQLNQPLALPGAQGPVRSSIWTAVHPRLLELVRAHTSTLLFVNSRRIAERLAGALNELAGETLVHAHHGSIARAQRQHIEDSLKAGQVKGLVATSSLELGIDMGAIDLVVQIEAPPSVASGLQRIGRAGHQGGGESRGIVFPKYRADLVACAALSRAMREGEVESSRYPRNPLDILAQHIVAMVSLEPWNVDGLFARVRCAAPFADLRRTQFDGVLDMLSGRYASEDLSDLRPRLVWDRITGELTPRDGARLVAVVNGGTIPDRGLYGVFLAGAERKAARVGELDEEMVFEAQPGETFILGASTWRIEEITHDRVLVSPAPGQPGRMPFWKGDAPSRPLEVGRKIGELVRELRALPAEAAMERLVRLHDLDARAAENLLQYLRDQAAATDAVPDDRTLVIERVRDELGDWRVCVLSPLGGQVHAPWAMAVVARAKAERDLHVEAIWSNDGFVLRFPELDKPPDSELVLPPADQVEKWLMEGLGGSALFAAKFRENAARALLLPRRRPGQRTPLWKQRKRSADLLAAAAQFPSFPILLETYRECLRDVFDVPALQTVLREVEQRTLRVVTVDSRTPSPFAATVLFGFVANFLYEGDAPLAERRAQALAIDHAQLRELLGEAELRELLDADALEEVERELQHLAPTHRVHSRDGLHDLLRRLGDLSPEEIAARVVSAEVAGELEALVQARRVVRLPGEPPRYLAVEDVSRYRDGLGVSPPPGIPAPLLEEVPDPLGDLVLRYARSHAPFTQDALARRYGVGVESLDPVVRRLVTAGKLLEGAFRPGGKHRELCEPEILGTIRRRSLAKLRREVDPVSPEVLGRFALRWHGLLQRRKGLDALLDIVDKLQGCPLPASLLETEILPARIEGYTPADLDALAAAGEVTWAGLEPLGDRDGRVALFLTDALPRLWRGPSEAALGERAQRLLEVLRRGGASFFPALHAAVGAGYPQDTLDALWELVWAGHVTNDSLRPLRAFTRPRGGRARKLPLAGGRSFRSRRAMPPAAEGRWSIVEERAQPRASSTEQVAALAQQLLARHGLVTREVVGAEDLPGGFTPLYEVLKRMEETGRIRRGYFVAGLGAAQFAGMPALEALRSLRGASETPEVTLLSAVDPANPYGALLPWPEVGDDGTGRGPTRSVGASVVIVAGALGAYLSRGGRQLFASLPADEPERSQVARAVALKLAELARRPESRREGILISEINGARAVDHFLASFLVEVGFTPSSQGFHLLRRPFEVTSPKESLLGTLRQGQP